MTKNTQHTPPDSAELARMVTPPHEAILAAGGLCLIATIIAIGWNFRGQHYLTPETGLGYALGIIGTTFMLMLLTYPLRKYVRWTRSWGLVKYWFRAHMLFGVVGPLCILYHCNFHLGSTNSNLTLFSMLVVAGSGIFGRYFYTRIHYGLYGRKATLSELTTTQAFSESKLNEVIALAPQLKSRIEGISGSSNHWIPNFLIGGFLMYWRYWQLQPILVRAYRVAASRNSWDRNTFKRNLKSARAHLRTYLSTSRKVRELAVYQRLFSLWHVLHVPLFVMLVLTATAHVFAVHMY